MSEQTSEASPTGAQSAGAAGAGAGRIANSASPAAERALSAIWEFVLNNVVVPLKRLGTSIGDWLATVGWGKFFLLSVLAMTIAAIVNSAFQNESIIVVDTHPPVTEPGVSVRITEDGIRITPGPTADPVPPAPPLPPVPPMPPEPPAAPGAPKATKGPAARPGSVQIDEKGIRINSQRDGKRVQVLIDGSGIRVEEGHADLPVDAPPAVTTGPDGSLVISLKALEDPALRADALEEVRGKIETLVEAQVDRQVAREARRYREKGGDWLMSFVFLMILAAITFKVVLGGKKKAERRAQVASVTAAEESLKRQLAEAHLKMMQAQVEPHFLFNTLASVDYLIETDPPTASKMQKNLIQYLRAALPQMREGSTTLGKEIQQCRAYLEILKFRMEDRLQYAVTVPQGLMSAQFPPMMLQSLVENSIKHGLEPKPEGGSITLTADIANGKLRVTVADTGLGFAAAATTGTNVGLANVRERLAALHGVAGRLSVEANSPHGTIVTIEVPYTFEADAAAAARS